MVIFFRPILSTQQHARYDVAGSSRVTESTKQTGYK